MRFCVRVFICLSKSSTVFTVPSKTYIKEYPCNDDPFKLASHSLTDAFHYENISVLK